MTPLSKIVVLEIGDRVSVGLAGGLLALFGAQVHVAVPNEAAAPHEKTRTKGKWSNPAATMFRKTKLAPGQEAAFLATADIVLTSSDTTPLPIPAPSPQNPRQIICDITAHGGRGARAGKPDSEAAMQALMGLADLTGGTDGPPVLARFPLLEGLAALHACAGILAGLIARKRDGTGQNIDISLHDCALASLAPHLPDHLAGPAPVRRIGNRHRHVAPWNSYATRDGPIVLGAATDRDFQRLSGAVDRPELAQDPRFATRPARLAEAAQLDSLVAAWCAARTSEQALAALQRAGVPGAPVTALPSLPQNFNFMVRGSVSMLPATNPGTAGVPVLSRPIHAHLSPPTAANIPPGTRDHPFPFTLQSKSNPPATAPPSPHPAIPNAPPLRGLKVVEIGRYATAALAGGQLAALGAEVVKLEPPEGDPMRGWEPQRNGLSLLFALTNAGKQSRTLDLRRPEGLAALRRLLESADVLIENLRPRSLERLGLDRRALATLNPALIHCAISGFGALSAYPGRAAFDLMAQAMSGMMDLTREADQAYKTGIWACDIAGGLAATVGVLASLLAETACDVDVALHDAGSWLTHWQWHAGPAPMGQIQPTPNTQGNHTLVENGETLPVRPFSAVMADPETTSRGIFLTATDEADNHWPVLGSPIRMSATPLQPAQTLAQLGADNPRRR